MRQKSSKRLTHAEGLPKTVLRAASEKRAEMVPGLLSPFPKQVENEEQRCRLRPLRRIEQPLPTAGTAIAVPAPRDRCDSRRRFGINIDETGSVSLEIRVTVTHTGRHFENPLPPSRPLPPGGKNNCVRTPESEHENRMLKKDC
jgi:hypothetical protein